MTHDVKYLFNNKHIFDIAQACGLFTAWEGPAPPDQRAGLCIGIRRTPGRTHSGGAALSPAGPAPARTLAASRNNETFFPDPKGW